MDWKVKTDELRAATLAAVDGLLASLKGERLYAISLQTDDGGMSVGPCANSEQGYAERCASEAEVEEQSPADLAYLRWAPAEWRYEMFDSAHFMETNQDFIAAGTSDTGDDFDSYFEHLLEAMTDALATLRAARAQALEGVTLFVTITDSDEAEDVENRSAAQLNPPALAAAFARRFG
jgi:hypothetical protein